MRNFRKLPVPVQTAHGYPCAHVPTGGSFLNPQSLRRPLTPPPLSAPDRGSKNIAEPARLRSLRVRADAAFPSNIGAKGSRREESRIFFQNIETPQKYMRNFRKLPVPVQTAHGYSCVPVPTGGSFLNPQTQRRPFTPPPLFAPDRSSKNIAEPARLRSLRAFPLRSLFEAYCRTAYLWARATAGGGCGFEIPQKPYGSCFRCSSKLRIGRAKCDNIGSIEKVSYI